MNIHEIIKRPVLTEKATNLTKDNFYAFEVHLDSNKHAVKNAIERIFKVKVSAVKMTKRAGKTRRAGKKMKTSQMPDKKVAYVKVKEGKIDIFPQA